MPTASVAPCSGPSCRCHDATSAEERRRPGNLPGSLPGGTPGRRRSPAVRRRDPRLAYLPADEPVSLEDIARAWRGIALANGLATESVVHEVDPDILDSLAFQRTGSSGPWSHADALAIIDVLEGDARIRRAQWRIVWTSGGQPALRWDGVGRRANLATLVSELQAAGQEAAERETARLARRKIADGYPRPVVATQLGLSCRTLRRLLARYPRQQGKAA